MRGHILPNVMTPVLVTATLNLGLAILAEATLVLPRRRHAGQPALARHADPYRQRVLLLRLMVDRGVPGAAAVLIILSVNLLADWLRDALNPKLR